MKTLLLCLPVALLTLARANPPAVPGIQQRENALLKRFDADGDGLLNSEERAQAAQTLRAERAQELSKRQEAVVTQTKEHTQRRDISLIRRFDANGDGVLNAQERTLAEKTLRDERTAFAAERKQP